MVAGSVGKTTIAVSVKTRDQLAALGRKDDTFDEIIERLLEYYTYKKGKPTKKEAR